MEKIKDEINQISKYILFCRQGENENLQKAMTWLNSISSQPLSINIFLEFCSTSKDDCERQYGIIFLNQIIHNIWNEMNENDQRNLIFQLCDLFVNENVWINSIAAAASNVDSLSPPTA